MEEAPENDEESSNSAHANGIALRYDRAANLQSTCHSLRFTDYHWTRSNIALKTFYI